MWYQMFPSHFEAKKRKDKLKSRIVTLKKWESQQGSIIVRSLNFLRAWKADSLRSLAKLSQRSWLSSDQEMMETKLYIPSNKILIWSQAPHFPWKFKSLAGKLLKFWCSNPHSGGFFFLLFLLLEMVRFSSSFSFVNSSIIMWSSVNNVAQDLGFS